MRRERGTVFWVAAALSATVLIGSSASAEGYRTSVGSGADEITVLVVRGTPYEMGHAMGSLLKGEVAACVNGFLATAREGDPEMYSSEELEAAWKATLPHTDSRYIEELRGLADASGVSLRTLRHAHMLPVVSPWSCSCLAVWGKATKDGGLYQIRNLDFMTEGGLQDYPVIVVYLPDEGIPHVSVTFAGIVAVNTGMNAKGIALSEKGNSPADGYPYEVNGAHFTSVFHRILYDAENLDGAIDILKATPWFKSYYFVVGSGSDKAGVKVKVDAPDITLWGPNDPADEFEPLPNAVYITMEDDQTVAFLKQHDGAHDQNTLIELSKMVGTDNGNLLNVVYDTARLEMWVALAEGEQPAKTRPYVHFKLRNFLDYSRRAPGVEAAASPLAAH